MMPDRPAVLQPPAVFTRSTCPYCGVGCGVVIESRGDQVTGVAGDPDHPANFGRLCTKGESLARTTEPLRQQQARLAQPSLRLQRDQPRRAAGWDEALDLVADRFAQCIAEHGPDSVAFYVSGQLLTEDYYVFNKLAKGLIGTNNIDTNSRLCMSSAVAGYKQSFGADAPPAAYLDIDHTDCLFITGSNTAWAHPVLFRRIEAARAARPGMKLIVVDPRKTDTAALADLHLAIAPGTDVALYRAMLHVMIAQRLIDPAYIDAHTEGFVPLQQLVADMGPQQAAGICQVPASDIETAARWFAGSPATLSLYCQGLNQSVHGTAKNTALIDLHLASRQLGRPGAGPLSLTGQPNAMGGREVGGMANLLSGHRDLANAGHRAEVAALWGVPQVPATPGLTAVELFEALHSGKVRMVWIACTNPAQSMPDLQRVHQALARAELVVVQDAYQTPATVAYADVLLPASTWGEKDGTVTNSERRISRVRPAVPPFGQSRHDWAIAADFGRRLATRLPGAPQHLFGYDVAEQVWNEHRETTRGRDLDITGLSYRMLEQQGPQQWPYRSGDSTGAVRLYADGRFETASGRARFSSAGYAPVAEPADAQFPLQLTTGRLRDHWHGMSRTGQLASLFAHRPEPAVYLHAKDRDDHGLAEGDLVRVRSRRGAMTLPVATSDEMRAGTVFIAMHWGPEWVSGRAGDDRMLGVNGLTSAAFDPVSRQPELKHCAVRLETPALPARLMVFGWVSAAAVTTTRQALLALFDDADFCSCVPFGRDREGLALRVAHRSALDAGRLARIARLFGLAQQPLLRYDDARTGNARHLALEGDRLSFAMLVGDMRPAAWLREYLETGTPVTAIGRLLLSPSATPPVPMVERGRVVCNCYDVREPAIRDALAGAPGTAAQRVEAVQRELSCGTRCGSCLPELRRLAASLVAAPH